MKDEGYMDKIFCQILPPPQIYKFSFTFIWTYWLYMAVLDTQLGRKWRNLKVYDNQIDKAEFVQDYRLSEKKD